MASPFLSITKIWHSKPYPSISPSPPELSAGGGAVVVIGGGTNIGAETARSFTEAEAIGYKDHVSLLGHFHVWLASPEAFFLKGKFVRVNWDVDELKEKAREIETIGLYGTGLGGRLFYGRCKGNGQSNLQ